MAPKFWMRVLICWWGLVGGALAHGFPLGALVGFAQFAGAVGEGVSLDTEGSGQGDFRAEEGDDAFGAVFRQGVPGLWVLAFDPPVTKRGDTFHML